MQSRCEPVSALHFLTYGRKFPVSLKRLDKLTSTVYNIQAVQNAAIAQPVERILGKDEVASSNLASSSIKRPKPFGFGLFIYG